MAGGEEAARWARNNAADYVKPVEGARPHVDAQQNIWTDSEVFLRWADHKQTFNAIQYGQRLTGERYTLYSHDEGANWFGPYFDRSPGASEAGDLDDDFDVEDVEQDNSDDETDPDQDISGSQPSSSDSSVLSTSSGSGILSASYSSGSSSPTITVHSTR